MEIKCERVWRNSLVVSVNVNHASQYNINVQQNKLNNYITPVHVNIVTERSSKVSSKGISTAQKVPVQNLMSPSGEVKQSKLQSKGNTTLAFRRGFDI